jgi:putative ABC transport system permease protein
MRILLLAARNLVRHKRKTLVTLLALVLGLAGLVVFQGFLTQTMFGFRDSMILSGLGHLEVAGQAGYFEDGETNPYSYPWKNIIPVSRVLASNPAVKAVIPSIGFLAIAGLGESSTTLQIKGYPADRMYFASMGGIAHPPRDRFDLGTMSEGIALSSLDQNKLILGETAARILGAKVGDTLTLMTPLPGNRLAGSDFAIAGIYRSPNTDKFVAYTDVATAATLTNVQKPPVLTVLVNSIDSVDSVVRSLPPGTAFRTWKDLATLYVQVNSTLNSFLIFIRMVILLVTLFILANAMNRVVLERMVEWGTLRAMGTTKAEILGIVVVEGCLQGVVGAILGIALGFAIAGIINGSGGIPYSDGLQTTMTFVIPTLESVWTNLVPATLVAGLASIFPGLRAIRLTPTECLRHV